MAHSYIPYNGVEQTYLFPPSALDWLPDDHLVYQIIDVVGELDLNAFHASYGMDGRGAPAYSPTMMVSILQYAWCMKIYSSRKIAASCRELVAGRIVSGGQFPDFRTINAFRNRHEAALNGLFLQSVRLCDRAGLVEMTANALDGTKPAANASRHKAMSYERLVTEEGRIQAEIDGYFKRAAEEDAADDARFGAENEGPKISDEIKRREKRIANIKSAKAAIESEAKEAADQKRAERAQKETAAAAGGKKLPGPPPAIDPAPKPSAQRSFTDPESRIMKDGSGAYVQGYNGQAMVDGRCQVIVACELTNQAGDVGHLPSMLAQTCENMGRPPERLLADPGYYSEANDKTAKDAGVLALIPPDRRRHGTPESPAAELTAEQTAGLSPADEMRHRVSTEAGRKAYRKRKAIVEPVFGQIKGGPGNPGCRGFLRRGLEKCSAEWKWVCATHNILKYVRYGKSDGGGFTSKECPKTAKIAGMPTTQCQMGY